MKEEKYLDNWINKEFHGLGSYYFDRNQVIEIMKQYASDERKELDDEINRLKEYVLKELNMAMDHYNNDQFAHRARAMANYISEAIYILSQNKQDEE